MATTAKKQPSQSLATHEVMRRLRARFSDTGYAVLAEVADGTGHKQSRWADALTMSLWPSRGLELIGFEIKVSRSDWVKELNSPGKAEAVCKYCDKWFVVVGNADIIKAGELPSTWGLMVPDGDGLKIAKQAPELSPVPLDRAFVAAIMRRCAEQSVDAKAIKAIEDETRRRTYDECRASFDREQARTANTFKQTSDRLAEKIRKFSEQTGISLDSYWNDFADVGEAVRRHKAGIDATEFIERARGAAAQILHVTEPFVKTEGA